MKRQRLSLLSLRKILSARVLPIFPKHYAWLLDLMWHRRERMTGQLISRGFNGQFANKLLVLIDGRTVYNPLFFRYRKLGISGYAVGRYRSYRGHSRAGRYAMGRQCRQRRDQYHYEKRQRYAGRRSDCQCRGNMIKSDDGTRYGVKMGDDSYARVSMPNITTMRRNLMSAPAVAVMVGIKTKAVSAAIPN